MGRGLRDENRNTQKCTKPQNSDPKKVHTKVRVDLKDVWWPKAIFAKGGTFRLRDQSAKTLEIVDAIFDGVS